MFNEVNDSDLIIDHGPFSILKCTQLRKLGLLNARDFSGERMRLLEENLQKLVSLKLTYPCQMKQSHFRYLFSGQTSNLHNLVKLSLIACWGLEDAGLQAVVETCKGSLQSLSLKCCKTLSGAALRGVVRQCSLLRRLNVAYASQVSPPRSAAAAAAFSYLDDVPYHLPKLAKLVVDLAYRKGHCLANLHGRMPDLAIAVSHSEFSNDEILLAF
ncbi:Uncharacterized protein GBIM_15768 [Gryllus bimaculatus]|nr:Uncharacterized protein GBIM_15768 [Gryllus bimaculatus]